MADLDILLPSFLILQALVACTILIQSILALGDSLQILDNKVFFPIQFLGWPECTELDSVFHPTAQVLPPYTILKPCS